MPKPIVVFLGPTLGHEEATMLLDAIYLPPAEQGSVVAAVTAYDPGAIALIDGAFAKVPAVRHKEILWALARGIPVHGAASIGALRAAELAPFGMRGHGFIHRWYRATPFADDDEVAVATMPAELGARALSEALINIRLTLKRAERRAVIPRDVRVALEDLARSLHFVDRTYERLFARARARFTAEWQDWIEATERFVAEHAIDQKKADAKALLQFLAANPPSKQTAPFAFRMTEAWAIDLDDAAIALPDPSDDA
ncbi:TfuA-like protein [Microvirga massiliensis]|uniref:TfuA-like protein n=1 Tax=Microvirga massiliensis TaxID=1033741 RepID=UPI00062B7A28|nr:TfuA-like protein [Microvirga massiliensis]